MMHLRMQAFTHYIIGMTEKRDTSLMRAILKKPHEYTKNGLGEWAAAVYYRNTWFQLLDQDS